MNANGRVNILEPINNSVFQLYDKIPIDEKTTSYRNSFDWKFRIQSVVQSIFSMVIF